MKSTSHFTRYIPILILLLTLPCLNSCKKGCTDSKASNYDEKAKKDDDSCIYRIKNNTTDETSGEGGDLYFVLENTPQNYTGVEVYVDNAYIGLLQRECTQNLDCETTCDKIKQLGLSQGSHSYYAILIRATTNGNEEVSKLESNSIFIADGDCKAILINN